MKTSGLPTTKEATESTPAPQPAKKVTPAKPKSHVLLGRKSVVVDEGKRAASLPVAPEKPHKFSKPYHNKFDSFNLKKPVEQNSAPPNTFAPINSNTSFPSHSSNPSAEPCEPRDPREQPQSHSQPQSNANNASRDPRRPQYQQPTSANESNFNNVNATASQSTPNYQSNAFPTQSHSEERSSPANSFNNMRFPNSQSDQQTNPINPQALQFVQQQNPQQNTSSQHLQQPPSNSQQYPSQSHGQQYNQQQHRGGRSGGNFVNSNPSDFQPLQNQGMNRRFQQVCPD